MKYYIVKIHRADRPHGGFLRACADGHIWQYSELNAALFGHKAIAESFAKIANESGEKTEIVEVSEK